MMIACKESDRRALANATSVVVGKVGEIRSSNSKQPANADVVERLEVVEE